MITAYWIFEYLKVLCGYLFLRDDTARIVQLVRQALAQVEL